MLIINLQRVFALRGIQNPFSALLKIGVSRPTASNLLNNRVLSIKSDYLEKICELLNCEPNDLYEWKPSNLTANIENHSLKGLRRDNSTADINQMLRNLPLDKLAQVESLLDGLKND
jgi:DNA-binding Xre family transcriptional regulator